MKAFGILTHVVVALMLALPAEAKTLKVAIPGLPSVGLNPLASANLPSLYTSAALFDALTWVAAGGIAKPQLAESWEAKDERTWVFKLRSGVSFSNGEPLTAESIKFFIDLLQSPEGATFLVTSELGPMTARVIDPLTLEVTTPSPNPFLPQELSLLRIMSPSHFKKVGADGVITQPVGSGPFVMEKLESGRMLLKASTGWHKPLVDNLELIAAPEGPSRLQALLSGRVDMALLLGPDDVGTVEGAGYKMVVQPEPAVIVIAFNTVKESPLQNLKVRQALNYAVNKDEIVGGILGGHSKVASQPASPLTFGFDPALKPYEYDPARAKKLLAEAGYPDGFSFITEIYMGAASYTPLVTQKVSSDLAKIGVKMDVRIIPTPKYARGLNQGDWEGTGISMDYSGSPSLDALRSFRRHSCFWRKPWYCDESIMPLLTKAYGTFDLEERRALTKQVLRYQRDQAAALFLHEQPRFDAMSKKVRNFSFSVGYIPYDKIDLQD